MRYTFNKKTKWLALFSALLIIGCTDDKKQAAPAPTQAPVVVPPVNQPVAPTPPAAPPASPTAPVAIPPQTGTSNPTPKSQVAKPERVAADHNQEGKPGTTPIPMMKPRSEPTPAAGSPKQPASPPAANTQLPDQLPPPPAVPAQPTALVPVTPPAADPQPPALPTQLPPPPTVPTQPVTVPAQPAAVPTQPVAVPTQPVAVPTQPVAVPTQPVAVPAQPVAGQPPINNLTETGTPKKVPPKAQPKPTTSNLDSTSKKLLTDLQKQKTIEAVDAYCKKAEKTFVTSVSQSDSSEKVSSLINKLLDECAKKRTDLSKQLLLDIQKQKTIAALDAYCKKAEKTFVNSTSQSDSSNNVSLLINKLLDDCAKKRTEIQSATAKQPAAANETANTAKQPASSYKSVAEVNAYCESQKTKLISQGAVVELKSNSETVVSAQLAALEVYCKAERAKFPQ